MSLCSQDESAAAAAATPEEEEAVAEEASARFYSKILDDIGLAIRHTVYSHHDFNTLHYL